MTGVRPWLLLIFGLALLFTLGFSLFQKAYLGYFDSYSYLELIAQQVVNYASKLVYLFFVIRCTTYLLREQRPWWFQAAIHAVLLVGFASFSAFVVMWLGHLLLPDEYFINSTNWFSRFTSGLVFNYFIYLAVVSIVIAYHFIEKERDQSLKRIEVEKLLTHSRLLQLQSQLNPHFLFNALNGISSMIDDDASTAQDAIANLSELLRYNLSFGERQTITLDEEIEITTLYTSLQKLRFSEKLTFEYHIPPDLGGYLVPPFILQPIIENAIKHGFDASHQQVHISVTAQRKGDRLHLIVTNDGAPLKPSYAMGTGLQNIHDRLASLYGAGEWLRIGEAGGKVCVAIIIN